MSYDGKCWQLASMFLMDEPAARTEIEAHTDKLAQIIQNTIEDYMRFDVRKDTEEPA